MCPSSYAASGRPAGPPAGERKIETLISELEHPDLKLAIRAARTLGCLRATQSVDALRAIVDSGSAIALRAEAVLSLIAIEGPETRPWLKSRRPQELRGGESCPDSTGERLAGGGAVSMPAKSDNYDRWVFCRDGHIHWGANGGAGLLLRHMPASGISTYLLTERSRWVDEGGTWGIPGGAMHRGESVEDAARREAAEEIWPLPPCRVTGIDEQDCGGGWRFHIVHADVSAAFAAYAASETDATGWFTLAQMTALRLHPGIRAWLTQQPVLGP